mmetsp:Transcript_3279/g.6505  ORF Transcript_3279/g.6505 Transcript_3279/m.6505 type:complete len:200 (+) Transcript_3279:90-689(+)|eukprot:CAMPEP_0171726668 /NCGR_PEP_ID=MMETSP0991-20121206/25813_1 /TAXON_ID=483369 /ORGANISM="non described non described, Strain CCMP2098" /LENGTH=199 /DNA_ID=CAMNT_0012320215 /DNA_START=30 /DNA_END=629 /DNA_ORIENTATION=+
MLSSIPELYKGIFLGAIATAALAVAEFLCLRESFFGIVRHKALVPPLDDDEKDQIQGLPASALCVASKDWGVLHAPFKMLLLVNQELKDSTGKSTKMSAGKVAAQCGHATLGAYKRGLRRSPGAVQAWEFTGQAKIAVKCPTIAELHATRDEAARRGISFYVVCDAGHTQTAPGSETVLAIGPAPVAVLNEFTRHFKLY